MTAMKSKSKSRSKSKSKSNTSSSSTVITDERFVHVHSDPRFKGVPLSKTKVAVDARFQRMFKDDSFKTVLTDKYGRKTVGSSRGGIERLYNYEERDEKVEGEEEEEEEEEDEGEAASVPLDYSRGEHLMSSSEEEDSDDDGDDVDGDEEEGSDADIWNDIYAVDVPRGDATVRFAVQNMDWEYVRALDLLMLFNSFKPSTGVVQRVAIYPSQFGKEQMTIEDSEGPAVFRESKKLKKSTTNNHAMYASADADYADSDGDSDDNSEVAVDSDDSALGSEKDDNDTGTAVDEVKLREYELKKLRYYFAIVTCDSVETAASLYDQLDDYEFEKTSNKLDLRFVPDDITFDDTEIKEQVTEVPREYAPREYTTAALENTNLSLTWDKDDEDRAQVTKRRFTKNDVLDMDFKAYLASSESESEDDLIDDVEQRTVEEDKRASKLKKKQRAKYKGLLDLVRTKEMEEEPKCDGDMEITFEPAIKENISEAVRDRLQRVKDIDGKGGNGPTVWEEYLKKRKQKRKDKKKALQRGETAGNGVNGDDDDDDRLVSDEDDIDWSDPYFASERNAMRPDKKAKKLKQPQESEEEQEEKRRQREELELLMIDEDDTAQPAGNHFNLDSILKEEKEAGKKKKWSSKKKKREALEAAANKPKDNFIIDTDDNRFDALYQSHHFALDPTDPNFKGTTGMQTLLKESRSRGSKVPTKNTLKESSVAASETPKRNANLANLVTSVKRKTELWCIARQAAKKIGKGT